MTRPKTVWSRSRVLQFQRWCRNWCWHSRIHSLAPSPTDCMMSGYLWHSCRCLFTSPGMLSQITLAPSAPMYLPERRVTRYRAARRGGRCRALAPRVLAQRRGLAPKPTFPLPFLAASQRLWALPRASPCLGFRQAGRRDRALLSHHSRCAGVSVLAQLCSARASRRQGAGGPRSPPAPGDSSSGCCKPGGPGTL